MVCIEVRSSQPQVLGRSHIWLRSFSWDLLKISQVCIELVSFPFFFLLVTLYGALILSRTFNEVKFERLKII